MKWLLHYNPGLPHQCAHAGAFKRAGIEVTPHRDGDADVHIVSGPWYALDRWRDSECIWLDRAFWGDPEYVSLGWVRGNGRVFPTGEHSRPKPECFDWTTRESTALVLADYKQDTAAMVAAAHEFFDFVRVRKHPAENGGKDPLRGALMLSDVVIGHSSTALVEAAICGRPVICTDMTNPVMPVASDWGRIRRPDRTEWLHELSWAQWTLAEIASGEAIEALKACQNTS